MSKDKDPLANYHPNLFPTIKRAGEFISHFILGPHLFSPVSEHTFENRGGGPMLDRELEKTDALNNMNQVYFPEEVE